jgi:hypothetical protein
VRRGLPRPADRKDGSSVPAAKSAYLGLGLCCLAGIAFFSIAYAVRHFDVPVGDDTYFYVGAIRAAGRFGLADAHIASRPAYPLTAAALASLVRSSPWGTAVALPFAMSVATGMSAAALAARWGAKGTSVGAYALLLSLSIVVSRLVAGRSENLMTVWLLLAALAVAGWVAGRRGIVAAAVLMLAAGLTEWPFLAAFIAILGGTLVLRRWGARLLPARLVPDWSLPARLRPMARATDSPSGGPGVRYGEEPRSLSLGEIAVAAVAAAVAVAFVVFAVHGTAPGDAVQRLPPTARFRPRLLAELSLAWAIPSTMLVLIGWWGARRRTTPLVGPLRRLFTFWLGIIGLVLVAGLFGLPLPTYRALTFGIPVALALAAAPFVWTELWPRVSRPSASRAGRSVAPKLRPAAGLRLALSVLLAALVVGPSTLAWFRTFRPRTTPAQLAQLATAGRYVATLPEGASAILVMDDPDVLRAFLYPRVLEAVLPTSRRARVLIFPGTTEDALAGRPTLRGDEDAVAVSRMLFEQIRPELEAGAPVLAARDFDLSAFRAALAEGAPMAGEGVAVVRGPAPRPGLLESSAAELTPLPPWWTLMLQSLALLVVLWASGSGWARLALPGAPWAVRAALSPALGAAVITFLTIVAVNAGFAPWNGAGLVVAVLAVGLSLAATRWPPARGAQPETATERVV